MKEKLATIAAFILLLWSVGGLWQVQINPLRWFTKVEPGQIWIWDNCDDDPFDCEKNDTIWVRKVSGNRVLCNSKPWFGNGKVIQITYKKTLFNQNMFYKIK